MGGEASFWQPVALFLAGVVASGVVMMIRGDFLGRRAAEDVARTSKEADEKISVEVNHAERRLNSRIDREMAVIGGHLKDIKQSLNRLESKGR